MESISLIFKNYSKTRQKLDLFSLASSPTVIYQYRFTTPYVTSYTAGTVRFTMNGSDYFTGFAGGESAQDMADILTSLGAGTWFVESDSEDGNIFYVNSNANVYTELELVSTTGTTTITSDNTVNLTSVINLAGTSGKVVMIDWDDGNVETVTLDTVAASYSHTYTVAGTYEIKLTGQVDEIMSMDGTLDNYTSVVFVGSYTLLEYIAFQNNAITTVTLLSTMTTVDTLLLADNALTTIDLTGLTLLGYVDLSTNALNQAAVDYVLDFLDTNGLLTGQCYLDGGTNSAPTAAGLTSKASLELKGWTVTVN